MCAQSQSLRQHQWENRLLLIITKDTTNSQYRDQLAEFEAAAAGLKERKLLRYQILPNAYQLQEEKGDWKDGADLYQRYASEEAEFEILLIGLDGGVKLRQRMVLTCSELFGRIDAMPMRRAEMRRTKRQ